MLLAEVLAALNPLPGHAVVDCTLGFAGHAAELLKRVAPDGLLVATDLDLANIEPARLKLEAGARWQFLTGTKKEIANLGIHSLKLAAVEKPLELREQADALFIHATIFVLVDKQRHIRGYYDGTTSTGVKDLVQDIKLLIGEERKRKREDAK